jgi:hypothetical protein
VIGSIPLTLVRLSGLTEVPGLSSSTTGANREWNFLSYPRNLVQTIELLLYYLRSSAVAL